MMDLSSLSNDIREQYPFPISHAYSYFESRIGIKDRYMALLTCFEVILKSIACISLSNYIHDIQDTTELDDVYLFRDLKETLSRPLSLGHWHSLLWSTLRPYATYKTRLTAPELFGFYFRTTETGKLKARQPYVNIIRHLIQERNEEAHHRNRSHSITSIHQSKLGALEKEIYTLLDGLHFLVDYPWLYAETAEYLDGKWTYHTNYACGSSYPFKQEKWQTTIPVNTRRCLVISNKRQVVLQLDPFVIVTSEGRLQQPDIFFFDGIFSSGRANFMNYHVSDYLDPVSEESPAAVANDALISLLQLLENRLPADYDEQAVSDKDQLSAGDIYRQAVTWAAQHSERQSVSLTALRSILKLPQVEALKQERDVEGDREKVDEGDETEPPFEGIPSWANLCYYVLANSGQEEMFYKDIAVEAEILKDQFDTNWHSGISSNVAGTVSKTMSTDLRFYKLRSGYYRLTQNNELLANPSWANLAYFVLKHNDPKHKGMHLQDITEKALTLKEKYSDWQASQAQTPSHTVSATMGMDHRFQQLPERGYWRLTQVESGENGRPYKKQVSSERKLAYDAVLAALGKSGIWEALPFGRTYYKLNKHTHIMLRYSKAHYKYGEIDYFMGVTPQYFHRMHDLGNAYILFVLDSANNVLVVPTGDFQNWVSDEDVSGSGTWPIAIYQSENHKKTERWVPGASREDVSMYLNNYSLLTRKMVPDTNTSTTPKKKRILRIKDLLEADLLYKGDKIFVKKNPELYAYIVDDRHIEYEGELWKYNDWGMHVTGWNAINIYRQFVLERSGETFDILRQKLKDSKY
ncbi:MAG: hypothetical protein P1S60_01945 [Anaerolineae bacterium]|nr:hypothetical protein [Anaerolineae bacterium]